MHILKSVSGKFQILEAFQRGKSWQPIILAFLGQSEHRNILDKELYRISLNFDSQLFFLLRDTETPENRKNVEHWSILEIYRIKTKIIFSPILKLNSAQSEITFNGGFSLQAYAQRRGNFHMENFTATVRPAPIYRKSMQINNDHPLAYHVALDYWDLQLLLNFRYLVLHIIFQLKK